MFLGAVRDLSWLAWAAFTAGGRHRGPGRAARAPRAAAAARRPAERGRLAGHAHRPGLQQPARRRAGQHAARLGRSRWCILARPPTWRPVTRPWRPHPVLGPPARQPSQVMSMGFYQMVTVQPGRLPLDDRPALPRRRGSLPRDRQAQPRPPHGRRPGVHRSVGDLGGLGAAAAGQLPPRRRRRPRRHPGRPSAHSGHASADPQFSSPHPGAQGPPRGRPGRPSRRSTARQAGQPPSAPVARRPAPALGGQPGHGQPPGGGGRDPARPSCSAPAYWWAGRPWPWPGCAAASGRPAGPAGGSRCPPARR